MANDKAKYGPSRRKIVRRAQGIKDAYWKGMDAKLFEGKKLEDNPYPEGSRLWIEWRRGYWGVC